MKITRRRILAASATAFASQTLLEKAFAQQKVPFQGGIPVAPKGLAGKKLPQLPLEFDTGEGMRIRVSAVTREIEYPWCIAFLPNGDMLVTERAGRLRIIRKGKLDPKPIEGTPKSYWAVESGLPGAIHGYMDVTLHPQFAQNQLIYLSYTKPIDEKKNVAAVARGRWDGNAIKDMKDIFVTEGSGPSRLAFDRNNKLYVTVSGRDPQSLETHGGKVLRLNDDGSIPQDNPFVGQANAKPEIFTYGHRNSLGLAMHPITGDMWQNENGPNGGDEINILKPGANYGWPKVSLGRTYSGPWQSDRPTHEKFEPPVVYWMPAVALSGMTFYTGDKLSKWKGDVFVGSMRTGEIPGTGHLERVLLNENMEELRRESLLVELRQRIRDVRQGPDGLLYVLTDEREGAVLRIEPAS
jgi:aldose sugar dehydrogenase